MFGKLDLRPRPRTDGEHRCAASSAIRHKTLILGTYLVIPIVNVVWSGAFTIEALRPLAATVAYEWFAWTAAVVAGRAAYLVWARGPRLALVWFVKLATDPLTDVIAYSPRFLGPA